MAYLALLACFLLHANAAAPEAYDKEQLQAAARFRQQHRKATDGRLCAAASVQDEQTFTGCSVMPTPDGDVGKEWCRGALRGVPTAEDLTAGQISVQWRARPGRGGATWSRS